LNLPQKNTSIMLNCFGIDKYDKLHGFMMYGVMWVVGPVSRENDYSFQFSNVGSYDVIVWISYTIYVFYFFIKLKNSHKELVLTWIKHNSSIDLDIYKTVTGLFNKTKTKSVEITVSMSNICQI